MFSKALNIYKESFSGLSHSVWLLCLIMFINRAGAMVLPFMTLYLTDDLHFTKTSAGWVMGAYGAGSILGAYIGGQLTDRFGYYYIQFYSLVLGSLLLFLLVFLEGFYVITATVFIFAAISDTLRPANSVAIAAYATEENRTRSFSLMRFAINLGFSIGPVVGGLVAQWIGYRWVFVIDGVTCLIAAFILSQYLPYKSSNKPIKQDIKVQDSNSAYKDSEYLTFIILVAIWATAFFQLFASVPLYWQTEWGFSKSTIGMLLGLNGLIIVLFEMPFIKSLEHVRKYMTMISIGSFFMIFAFLTLLTGWHHIFPALLFIVLMSFAEMFAMPFMTNYAVSKPSENRRGQYMALYSMAYGIAHILAPVGSLAIADKFGFQYTYILMIIMSLGLTISFFSLSKR